MGAIFAGLFVTIRSFVCTWISRFITLSPETSMVLKLNAALMILVGYTWIGTIITIAAKQYADMMSHDKLAQSIYRSLLNLQKYEKLLTLASALVAFYWLGWSLFYDAFGWPAHLLPQKH